MQKLRSSVFRICSAEEPYTEPRELVGQNKALRASPAVGQEFSLSSFCLPGSFFNEKTTCNGNGESGFHL